MSTACGRASGSAGGGAGPTQVVERHQAPVTVAAGSDGTATALCASGEQMLGGGYEVSDQGSNPYASYPSAATTWTVHVHNYRSASFQVTAFADCLQASFSVGATIISGATDTGYPPPATHYDANTGADCPSGSTLTGGGFTLSGDANGYMWDLRPSRNPAFWNSWVAIAFAQTGPITVTPYAICATAHLANPALPHPSSAFTIPAMQNTAGTASCPAGEILTAGGYLDATDGLTYAFTSPPVRADTNAPNDASAPDGTPITTWRVRGSNYTDFDHSEWAWLVCLTLGEPSTITPSPSASTSPPTPNSPPTLTVPPTPTRTPLPVISFVVKPTSFHQTCDGSLDPLPAETVTLGNTGNTVFGWATNASLAPNGHSWTTVNPSSGSLDANRQSTLTVTPVSDLCQQLFNAKVTADTDLGLDIYLTTVGGAPSHHVSEVVTPYVPG